MQLTTVAAHFLKSEISQRTPLIFGLGVEGLSTYQFLRKHLSTEKIVLTDDKAVELLSTEWQSILKTDTNVQFLPITEVGQSVTEELWVIKTPGIPFTHPLCTQLEGRNPIYTSNTELFFGVIASLPKELQPKTIGITGTKGKSTTTSVIYHVLQKANKAVFLAGNIGVPALNTIAELEKIPDTDLHTAIVVLELSSHQLQALPYSPHIAVVQNITPEHLDYYEDFEEYWQAKSAITKYQSAEDIVIYSPNFEIPTQFATFSPAQKYPYSITNSPDCVAGVKNGWVYLEDTQIVATNKLPLMGEHNLLNILPAVIVAGLFKIPHDVIEAALLSFKSLPHRLEFVAEKKGVQYYNDSQATTPEAAVAAIRSFPGKQIVLLAGGSDKGVTFETVATEILSQNVQHVLLFPPMGAQIEAAVRGQAGLASKLPTFHPVSNMQEAVQKAARLATSNAIVLLSPACASFGLFKNYQDRGNQFKTAVIAL